MPSGVLSASDDRPCASVRAEARNPKPQNATESSRGPGARLSISSAGTARNAAWRRKVEGFRSLGALWGFFGGKKRGLGGSGDTGHWRSVLRTWSWWYSRSCSGHPRYHRKRSGDAKPRTTRDLILWAVVGILH